jgi:hypothetical protein
MGDEPYEKEWRDELLALLLSANLDQAIIEKAKSLKQAHLPESVFWFRAVKKHSLQNLEEDTIWVSGADEFNDPFDSLYSVNAQSVLVSKVDQWLSSPLCIHALKRRLEPEEIDLLRRSNDCIKTLVHMVLSKDPEIPQERYDKIAEEARAAMNEVYAGGLASIIERSQRGMKVCCFAQNNKSIVMWSHYARDHKGFCIEYGVKDNLQSNFAARLWPVIYRNDFFDATRSFLDDADRKGFNNLFGFAAALCKSPEWEYEEEWRVVAPFGESCKSFAVSVSPPKAIYLGVRISQTDKMQIIDIAKRKGIQVFQMVLSKDSFSLIPERIL